MLSILINIWRTKTTGILRKGLFPFLIALCISVPVRASDDVRVWYVDAAQGSVVTSDGRSWETAFSSIQMAINAAVAAGASENSPAEVWVAAGTYTGVGGEILAADGSSMAECVVAMAEHVHLYGGFAGQETQREQRCVADNTTTIDGGTDRSKWLSCVKGADNATLDGFFVTHGHGDMGNDFESFSGGGMHNDGVSPCVANCIFEKNISMIAGAGILNTNDASPTVLKCSFRQNDALMGGGAGMFNYRGASPTVSDCVFTENGANYGGGMYNSSASPLVTNCEFIRNSANSAAAGMYNEDGSSAKIQDCTFTENTVDAFRDFKGGGMYNAASSPTVERCTFIRNSVVRNDTAEKAVAMGGGMYNANSSPIVTDCVFSQNTLENTYKAQGGGMYNASSSPVVTNCVFSQNSGIGDSCFGGGMHNKESSPILSGCRFEANAGSGVCNEESSAPRLENCILADSGFFGVENWYSASPELMNCVVYGNLLGGVFCYDSSTNLTNSIVWGNLDSSIRKHYYSSVTATFSCIAGGYDGVGNIDADPMFWNFLEGDFRLHLSSPCLNSGTASDAPATDMRGVTRPQGGGVDMGVSENSTTECLDSDGEGLPNVFEELYSGTNPNRADSDSNGANDFDAWFSYRIWYVDAASIASEPDGKSWATAYPDIQSAINRAYICGGGEIWVAKGAYRSTGDTVVTLHPNTHLYGGFSGQESSRSQRAWEINATIIDGEDTRRGVRGANNATLDGFIIMRGYQPYIGAGMLNYKSSPTIRNCTFSKNLAEGSRGFGGGMYNQSASPVLINCVFFQNNAFNGGAICNQESEPVLTNCTFVANSADATGESIGGVSALISMGDSSCMYRENKGGALFNADSSPRLKNCIVWGNSEEGIYNCESSPTVTYSCIEGGNDGEGNIALAPLFVNASSGNLRLSAASPCVDTANSTDAPTEDILGNARPWGNGVDMGAYEYRLEGVDSTPPVITLLGATLITLECGASWTPPGFIAQDNVDGDLTGQVVFTGWEEDNITTPGVYTLRYNVEDSSGNKAQQVVRTVTVVDTTPPEITLQGENPFIIDSSERYIDPGATVLDTCDSSLNSVIINTADVRPNMAGVYTVTFNATDAEGNAAIPKTRTVIVRDTLPPVITLQGDASVIVPVGEAYVEPGYSAFDICDGDLTESVVVGGAVVNENTPVGRYLITYNVTDSAGNAAIQVTRMVIVRDTMPPVIELTGAVSLGLRQGDAYIEPGYSAFDAHDGDLTEDVVVGGAVINAATPPGRYVITYDVTDSVGNAAVQVTRTVIVIGKVLYVDAANNTDSPTGHMWKYAFPSIQQAIDTAVSAGVSQNAPIEIWVAAGVYTEEAEQVVRMAEHISLYGGFSGRETRRSHRDWMKNETFIDGEKSKRCILGATNATLDGFFVVKGYANLGAGMCNTASSPTVSNCIFRHNSAATNGGGMYTSNGGTPLLNKCRFEQNNASSGGGMSNSSASPVLKGCVFSENTANVGGAMANSSSANPELTECLFEKNVGEYRGGGMFGDAASPVLKNCRFSENTAPQGGGMYNARGAVPILASCMFMQNSAVGTADDECNGGGGIFNMMSSPILENCVFSQNTANACGGAIKDHLQSSPVLMNCTFIRNTALLNGNALEDGAYGGATVTNCIFWAADVDAGAEIFYEGEVSPTVTYSCIKGGYEGIGNIDADPSFLDVEAGNFRLQQASPCIDAGTDVDAPETDCLGGFRPYGAGVDMGAYESLPQLHNGDSDGDGRFGLTELLRVIQLYNSNGYHCAQGGDSSEDGYMPRSGDTNCRSHMADYKDGADWYIELSELLRIIQFFNAGGYHKCDDAASDEGYCVGAPSVEN